ncbi:MAG: hypothetical protein R3A48_24595 [Polyangiales bacterium]
MLEDGRQGTHVLGEGVEARLLLGKLDRAQAGRRHRDHRADHGQRRAQRRHHRLPPRLERVPLRLRCVHRVAPRRHEGVPEERSERLDRGRPQRQHHRSIQRSREISSLTHGDAVLPGRDLDADRLNALDDGDDLTDRLGQIPQPRARNHTVSR